MSFGMEDVDRYIVAYKKDNAPSEDEVLARRNGEEWNNDTADKYAQKVFFLMKNFTQLFFQIIFIHFFFCTES